MGNPEELKDLLNAERDEITRARLGWIGGLSLISANVLGMTANVFSFGIKVSGQRFVRGVPDKTEIRWEWSGVEKCQMVPRVDSEGEVSIKEECWVPSGRGDTYESDEYHPTPHEHFTPGTPDHWEDIHEIEWKYPLLTLIGTGICLGAVGIAYARKRWLDYREDFVTIKKKRITQMLDYFTAQVIKERFGQIDRAIEQLKTRRVPPQ